MMSSNSPAEKFAHMMTPQSEALEKFAAVLKSGLLDPKDPSDFQQIMDAAINRYHVRPEDLASQCQVSRPSISRWVSGKSLPHVLMRPLIIDWLISHIIDKSKLSND